MKLLFTTLILLLAAIYVGSIAMDDPGYIIIGYHGQVLRTSFIFFALVTILAGILLYYTVRILANIWSTPKKVGGWNADRKEKKAQKSLSKGYAALTEGNWEAAERSLSHDAKISDRLSYIHYLGAAQAAQSMGKVEKRDNYLQLAHSSAPQADVAVGITRAELQMQEGQTEMARITLEELLANNQNHPRVLSLLSDLHLANEDWESIQPLIKRLKKNRALPLENIEALESKTWLGLLSSSDADITDIKQIWSTVPKKLKEDPELLFTYLEKLAHSSESAATIPLIEKSLNKSWDDRLISLYGLASGNDSVKQLERAEKWLPAREEDHKLLTVLGILCNKNELWGKAKHYLETAVEFGAGPEVYRQLAETLENMGKSEEASACCKKGLFLATDPSQAIAVIK